MGDEPADGPPYRWTPERMRASRPSPLPMRPPWPEGEGADGRLPASVLDLAAPPGCVRRPAEGVRVWTLLLSEQGPAAEAAGAAALAAAEYGVYRGLGPGAARRRFAVVRGGLRLLAAAHLGCRPGGIAVLDGACPLCARPHDCVAAGEGAGPVRFSWDRSGDLVVYALSATTVGVGAAPLAGDGDRAARAAALRTARRTAAGRALIRGGCAAGPGVTGARTVDQVAVPPGHTAEVVVVRRVPASSGPERPGAIL
ncbi:hypothetical protein [Streptomyces sp. NPDC096323]|uniref:hypothetical protein n=1 Tax=Streptomyces sp. NPDC096323 TaxID=3155822 RepID=UPI003319568D